MLAANVRRTASAWLSAAGRWLALRTRGVQHAAAQESVARVTECGGVYERSWIHAQPCFPRRTLRRRGGCPLIDQH